MRSWTTKSLQDLEHLYWTEMATKLRADGFDPLDEQPPYEWLVENGYSGLIRALRRDHDLTPTEFYVDVLGIEPDDDPYWPIKHEEMIGALEAYLDELRNRRDHPETTVGTIRSRLRRFVETYVEVHGREDLISPLLNEDERPAEIERAMGVFDVLDEQLGSVGSKFKYLEDTRRWYRWLQDAGRAAYNPLERIDRRFGWERPEWDNRALEAGQVRALYAAAERGREQLVVVGLAGWGLRPSELASLEADQIRLDPEDDIRPYLEFEERKNGPGTVSLLVGAEHLQERVDELAEGQGWSGYIFPSDRSVTGHRHPDTIREWFANVVERADVTVDGRRPTPKMGRRFWYARYTEAVGQLLKRLEGIAEDQGSSSAKVVLENYLSEADRRRQRRDAMASALGNAFERA